MWGMPSILSLFCNEFNKFNNTRARMLDSIYHMTLRLLLTLISRVKNVIILSLCMQRCYGRHIISQIILSLCMQRCYGRHIISQPLVVCRFYCMALFHSQMRRHMINFFITLCMMGNWSCFCYRLLLFFSNLTIYKNPFLNTIRVPNGLDSD